MDILTRLFDLAFTKPEAEREVFLAEIPKIIKVDNFEEKLFIYLYKHSTLKGRMAVVSLLRQPMQLCAFQAMRSETV